MSLILKADKREVFGKKVAAEREAGRLPAVVYGRKEIVGSVFVDRIEFEKIWREAGESGVVTVQMPAGTDKEVLIHDIQHDPITDRPIHVDFYAIEKDKEVEVDIPLVYVGESPAVKELGAILVKVMHELPVRALPKDLPKEITIDISLLKDLESSIHIKDLTLPAGVQFVSDPEEVVTLVEEAREEEAEETAAAPDLDSIEVEKKGKQEATEEPADN